MSQERKAVQVPKAHKKPDQGNGKRVRLTQQAMMVFYREQSYLTGPFAKEILLRKKAYERYFEQIMQEGQAAGIFKPDLDPKMLTFGLLGMCNWLSQWYKPSGRYTHQQIAGMFVEMVEHGLVPCSSPDPSRAK